MARTKKVTAHLEPAPYDLAHPLNEAPARLRHDPRIPHQRRTAFWVVDKDTRVGRIVMVEFEDKGGWWYQPEVVVDPSAPKPKVKAVDGPLPRRKLAVEAVLANTG